MIEITKSKCKAAEMFLHSFDINDSAGTIKAILSYKKISFEDIKYKKEDWDKMLHEEKKKFEFGTLPVLQIENKFLSREAPIELYLARKYDLMGKTLEDEFLISSLMYSICDLRILTRPAFTPESEEEKEKQEQLIDELLNTHFPNYLKIFEKKFLEKGCTVPEGERYYLGNYFSLIDIYMTFFLYFIFKHPLRCNLLEEILIANAPHLNQLIERIHNNELCDFFDNCYIIGNPL